MGISADEFWQRSQNGKAMVITIARLSNVEMVRSICEWLSAMYERDLEAGNVANGASRQQARVAAENGAETLRQMAEGINDRNAVSIATSIIDTAFQRHYEKGKPHYDKAMLWFSDELRKRTKD